MKKRRWKSIEYMALINGGEIIPKDADTDIIAEFMETWDSKEIMVILEADANRSKAQNRFFHGCILPATQRILTFKGMPRAEDTEFVKEVILKKPYLTVNHGTPEEYIKSTSSLTVDEFWEFCNWCIELIVTLGGNLTAREEAEYKKVVERLHMTKAIDESLAK